MTVDWTGRSSRKKKDPSEFLVSMLLVQTKYLPLPERDSNERGGTARARLDSAVLSECIMTQGRTITSQHKQEVVLQFMEMKIGLRSRVLKNCGICPYFCI